MKGLLAALLVLLLAAGALVATSGLFRETPAEQTTVEIEQNAFYLWNVYEGKLEARNVELVMSEFPGNATIVELAPEGRQVERGDLLVKFDDVQLKRDLLRLERDFALARIDLDAQNKAKLPLELRELQHNLLEARQAYEEQNRRAEETAQLRRDSPQLVSQHEVEKEQLEARKLKSRQEGLEVQLDLTRSFLHPAARAGAEATLAAASNALELARHQLDKSVILAPSAGTVVHRPLHIGTEYRTIRVGDSIYKNQVFMALPDLRDIIVECHVPEAELSLVQVGEASTVVPVAFPELTLNGRVESIGSTAQSRPGMADWQKFFRLTIAISKPDPRLRSGMSVYCQVLSYHNPEALVAPRAAVHWKDDQAFCHRPGQTAPQPVTVGRANRGHIEILDGLAPGDLVVLPD